MRIDDPTLFSTVIDRRESDSIKWGKYAGRDVLPLWVADMDFAAPPAVLAALQARIGHGVFGYAQPQASVVLAVVEHLAAAYDWAIEPDWIVWLPGLVSGLNICCRAVDGDVFTATPVYPPFLSAPGHQGKRLHTAPLQETEQGWQWDFPATEAALTPETGLFLLCHPHNPVGRCWSATELQAIAALCKRHDLILCSDEIHCGLVLDQHRQHTPMARLVPEIAARTITLMAPSKTFNIPGLGCALAIIPDAGLRRRFRAAMEGIVPHVNALGLVACEAALRGAGDWHHALLGVLRANRDRLTQAVAELPGLRMQPVEATYLAWIDARGLGLEDPVRYFETQGLGFSDGRDFSPGTASAGWLRFNFGCPPATLEEALRRLRTAIHRLR